MEFLNVVYSIVPAAIAYTMPLLMGALGGLYSERSGVTNLCIEGLMLTGCFASATIIYLLQSAGVGFNLAIVIGIVVAMLAGGLLSILHAVAAINLKSNQVISGTAINMLATALTLFLAQTITGSGNVTILRGIIRSDVPLLSKIPGVDVHKMRYIGVILSGLLSGLGGACILVTYAGEYNSTSGINGLGFLAIAAMIFGQWKPLGILASTFFFGLCMTIANMGRVIPLFQSIPTGYLGLFPYVATLVALVASSRKSAAPLASGEPF